jgi:hypothetical protein
MVGERQCFLVLHRADERMFSRIDSNYTIDSKRI